MSKNKRITFGILVIAAMLSVLSACSGSNVNLGANGTLDESDLGFDLNKALKSVYTTMSGFQMDFFNVDFTTYDMTNPDNVNILQLAKEYLPIESNGSGTESVNASDLQTLMKEAFGIKLPLASTGMYSYDANSGKFSWPGSDPGFSVDVFKAVDFAVNKGGTITAHTDFYTFDMDQSDPDFLTENIKKPAEQWDAGIVYAKVASPAITFKVNKDYKFFPMRLVKIESKLNDWTAVQGTYTSATGTAKLSFAQNTDGQAAQHGLSLTVTSNGQSYTMNGLITGNYAYIGASDFFSTIFLTLNDDGTVTVSGASGASSDDKIAGVYTKKQGDA